MYVSSKLMDNIENVHWDKLGIAPLASIHMSDLLLSNFGFLFILVICSGENETKNLSMSAFIAILK